MIRRQTDEHGHPVCLLFEREPDIHLYPRYNDTVNRPVALDSMERRAAELRYRSTERFLADVGQMRNNAY